ncbi:hypothetical protein ACQEU5_23670 [Marinactinospora thermotolerans]|uniref:hypothetical protein n=1 Tax=Marinactinospora thermotolerans TaxID=531310 RepID=UPI003D94C3EF
MKMKRDGDLTHGPGPMGAAERPEDVQGAPTNEEPVATGVPQPREDFSEAGVQEPSGSSQEPEQEMAGARPEGGEDAGARLFTPEEVDRFRSQWRDVQGDFVDSPRDAVHDADRLVGEIMDSLTAKFSEHKRRLEEQWSSGGEPETEELRVALRRYRTFLDQLLMGR